MIVNLLCWLIFYMHENISLKIVNHNIPTYYGFLKTFHNVFLVKDFILIIYELFLLSCELLLLYKSQYLSRICLFTLHLIENFAIITFIKHFLLIIKFCVHTQQIIL